MNTSPGLLGLLLGLLTRFRVAEEFVSGENFSENLSLVFRFFLVVNLSVSGVSQQSICKLFREYLFSINGLTIDRNLKSWQNAASFV